MHCENRADASSSDFAQDTARYLCGVRHLVLLQKNKIITKLNDPNYRRFNEQQARIPADMPQRMEQIDLFHYFFQLDRMLVRRRQSRTGHGNTHRIIV